MYNRELECYSVMQEFASANSYEIKYRILFEDLIVIRRPIVQTLKFATLSPTSN